MQANFTLMTMKIFQMPNFKIYSFGKKNSVMEFLTSAQGTNRTLQSFRWPCEMITLSIGHFESPTEVQLKIWGKTFSL